MVLCSENKVIKESLHLNRVLLFPSICILVSLVPAQSCFIHWYIWLNKHLLALTVHTVPFLCLRCHQILHGIVPELCSGLHSHWVEEACQCSREGAMEALVMSSGSHHPAGHRQPNGCLCQITLLLVGEKTYKPFPESLAGEPGHDIELSVKKQKLSPFHLLSSS